MHVLDFADFFATFLRLGLEAFKKFPGLYPGKVTRNDDPEARGRIQALVPEVGHRVAPDVWILPSIPGAGPDHGQFHPPEVGDGVWVSFQRGDPSMPRVYLGGWYGKPRGVNDVPEEFQTSSEGTSPTTRGFKTKAGHIFFFQDKAGDESIRLVWHQPEEGGIGKFSLLDFDKNGSILFTNKNGSLIQLDAENSQIKVIDENGNFVTMDSSGIQLVSKKGDSLTLKGGIQMITSGDIVLTGASLNANVGGVSLGQGATFPIPKGSEMLSFLSQIVTWAMTHVHPVIGPTATGPTTVPLGTPSPSMLSPTNKTK